MALVVDRERESLSGADELQELRRPIRTGLCLALLVLGWLWVVAEATMQVAPPRPLPLVPPVILLATAGLVLLSSGLPEAWRNWLLLAGTGAALAVGFRSTGAVAWVYYQSLVVTVGLVIAGTAAGVATAAGLTVATLASSMGSGSIAPEILAPLGLLWAALAVNWLASTNLYTVLRWALDSQSRAWRTADEVSRRREQLRRTLDSLQHAHAALSRTSRELEEARLEAEESRRVKARFVSNISHELRTPINIIVGFAELTCFSPETYGDFEWPPALREDLLTIWRNAEHLLHMIDDVLDLAQIEAARLPITPEPTDLAQLIRDTVATASGLLRDSGLDLRVSLPPSIGPLDLDRTRIRQVLLNLINNAVRATRSGYIEVLAEYDDVQVTVTVRDTGQGIPVDRLELIFEEFEQVDTSLRRPHQGVGLGLAICRQFVRLHGGRIWVESVLGEGSAFHFSLPLPGRAAMRAHLGQHLPDLPQRPRRPQERAKVVALCGDDLVGRVLERHAEHLEVFTSETVESAVVAVQEQHPQLLFVGVDTGAEVGEALAQAREVAAAASPGILPALVASFPTERRAGASLGVEEFLIKPVTSQQVVGAVRRLCGDPSRLLLVDDEADMLALLGRIVAQEWPQAEVVGVTSGEQALAVLNDLRPSAVLLDLLMPGMGGVEFLRRMRARGVGPMPPVAVITARGPAEEVAVPGQAEMTILRTGGLEAGEMVRLLEALAQALPARYVSSPALSSSSPATA
ncbi:MAG: hybrid sensor histidine kinase/response regulator [Anaerolineae bacterium]|nr:hybrid sensor histidine kinase/response regulator [Anaerolineae bacterium]